MFCRQEDAKKRKNDVAVVQQNSDILRDTAGIAGKVPNDTVKSTIAISGGGGKVKKGGKGAANVVVKNANFNYSHYFRNVAVGYNVLLETFQYLKVKVSTMKNFQIDLKLC